MAEAEINPGWQKAESMAVAGRRAPRAPGVYAIGSVPRVGGIPVAPEFVYVGRAIGRNGLQGRLRQHLPRREQNLALREWLLTPPPCLEIWFAVTRTALEAIELEATLIHELNPRFNSRGCPKTAAERAAAPAAA
jgi:excinuclease UvrABC nuclease subunit